jgi:hypothetical protein
MWEEQGHARPYSVHKTTLYKHHTLLQDINPDLIIARGHRAKYIDVCWVYRLGLNPVYMI